MSARVQSLPQLGTMLRLLLWFTWPTLPAGAVDALALAAPAQEQAPGRARWAAPQSALIACVAMGGLTAR